MSELTPITREEMYLDEIADALENGGGGGGSFEPTDEQLAAMNSGITAEDVEQIDTNKTNISLLNQMVTTLSFKSGQPATLRFGNARAALAVGFVQGVGTVFMSIQTTSGNAIIYKSLYDGTVLTPTYISYDTSTSELVFNVDSPYYSNLLILSAAT
jgi:hypothetical protein